MHGTKEEGRRIHVTYISNISNVLARDPCTEPGPAHDLPNDVHLRMPLPRLQPTPPETLQHALPFDARPTAKRRALALRVCLVVDEPVFLVVPAPPAPAITLAAFPRVLPVLLLRVTPAPPALPAAIPAPTPPAPPARPPSLVVGLRLVVVRPRAPVLPVLRVLVFRPPPPAPVARPAAPSSPRPPLLPVVVQRRGIIVVLILGTARRRRRTVVLVVASAAVATPPSGAAAAGGWDGGWVGRVCVWCGVSVGVGGVCGVWQRL